MSCIGNFEENMDLSRIYLAVKPYFLLQAVEIDDVDNTTSREYLIPIDHESFYDGRVFGEIKSSATVHLEDGLLTAKIETPEDTYHIEPSWRHFSGNFILDGHQNVIK